LRRCADLSESVVIDRIFVFRLVMAMTALRAGVAAAAADRPAPPWAHEPLNVAAGCLVESVYFYDQYRERCGDDAWVRVLQWGAKEDDEVVAGHAVAVFAIADRLWAWDINYGFLPLDLPAAQRDDLDLVSRPILAKYPRVAPRDPMYRFDFPQSPADHPPAARLLEIDAGLRDASIVAEKLGRHRPVNLVRFSYVGRDGIGEGAAVVFLFHGRYCVYSPLVGTVPFRARGSVQNLRLVREALRRMVPGAFAVRPLREE
jgi:hypothetical protein